VVILTTRLRWALRKKEERKKEEAKEKQWRRKEEEFVRLLFFTGCEVCLGHSQRCSVSEMTQLLGIFTMRNYDFRNINIAKMLNEISLVEMLNLNRHSEG
jgi:hypothetical protein